MFSVQPSNFTIIFTWLMKRKTERFYQSQSVLKIFVEILRRSFAKPYEAALDPLKYYIVKK